MPESQKSRGFRFTRELHVRKGWEFRRAYRKGGRAQGRLVTLVVCPNRLPYSRLGLSVGRKLGGAVRRNKIKRMIREAFRLTRWELEARAGSVDVVVIPRLAEGKYLLEELMQELPVLAAKARERTRGKQPPRRGRKPGNR